VDPVTLGTGLAAIAGGVGGALGSQLWAGLTDLVRRPFRRDHFDCAIKAPPSGSEELGLLERAPANKLRAIALAEVLVARVDVDRSFGEALAEWWEKAGQIRMDVGAVVNTVSGTQHGPVLQGRDFSGLSISTTSPAPPQDPRSPESRS
jgi:hypothetical protein